MRHLTGYLASCAVALLCAATAPLNVASAQSQPDVHVRGYGRADGSYVKPHYQSASDGNPYNNYSVPGNVNPYTGSVATGNPETYLRNYYGGIGSTGTYHTWQGYQAK